MTRACSFGATLDLTRVAMSQSLLVDKHQVGLVNHLVHRFELGVLVARHLELESGESLRWRRILSFLLGLCLSLLFVGALARLSLRCRTHFISFITFYNKDI